MPATFNGVIHQIAVRESALCEVEGVRQCFHALDLRAQASICEIARTSGREYIVFMPAVFGGHRGIRKSGGISHIRRAVPAESQTAAHGHEILKTVHSLKEHPPCGRSASGKPSERTMGARLLKSRIRHIGRKGVIMTFQGRHQIIFQFTGIENRRCIVIPLVAGSQIWHDDDQRRNQSVLDHMIDHVVEAVTVFVHPCTLVSVCPMLKVQNVVFGSIVVLIISIRQTSNGRTIADIVFGVIRKRFQCALLSGFTVIPIRHGAQCDIFHGNGSFGTRVFLRPTFTFS